MTNLETIEEMERYILKLEERLDLLLDLLQGLLAQKSVKLVWAEDYDEMADAIENADD